MTGGTEHTYQKRYQAGRDTDWTVSGQPGRTGARFDYSAWYFPSPVPSDYETVRVVTSQEPCQAPCRAERTRLRIDVCRSPQEQAPSAPAMRPSCKERAYLRTVRLQL